MKTFRHHLMPAVLAVAASLASVGVFAQEFKIGIVNAERINRDSNAAKQALQRLEGEFLKREKDLNDAFGAFRQTAEKFEREAPTLSESQRTSRQKQLMEQDRELQKKRRELSEDVTARRNEENQGLIEKVTRVIRAVAESEKYDLVIQAQDSVYFNPKHDITDKVIKALNASSGK